MGARLKTSIPLSELADQFDIHDIHELKAAIRQADLPRIQVSLSAVKCWRPVREAWIADGAVHVRWINPHASFGRTYSASEIRDYCRFCIADVLDPIHPDIIHTDKEEEE